MAHNKKSLRTLDSDGAMQAGATALKRVCPDLRRVLGVTGVPPLGRHAQGFEGLASIITGQQLSASSAEAIWTRTRASVRPFKPKVLLAKSEDELRASGLSAAKVRTLRATANAIAEGQLDLVRLDAASDDEIRNALTAISGIGPWTANIYIMFCLGRADAWAASDLALQLAARSALRLPEKPDAAALEAIATRWQPWRAVAARILWAWHAHPASRAGREGAAGE
jgi:DNA-3-methyladenine glycosylase II